MKKLWKCSVCGYIHEGEHNFKALGKSKEEIKEILKKLGIDENARGETLSITQFAELSNLLFRSSQIM